MGNIGDSISDSAPTVGTAGPGYATTINSLLTELKARLIAKIPLSSLLTNSNLDLNGQALLNAAYITLANEAVSPVASPSNRMAAFAGDFWWVSPSGAIKITSGAGLNAAGVGGITGDYSGAGPMEFRYDTANTRYDAFANQSTNTWAYVRARGFDIAGGATSAFRLRHLYNGTSNEQLTWTDTVAADGILQVNSNTVESSSVEVGDFTRHSTHYLIISAVEFSRGLFSGAGTASLATDGNDVSYVRFSDAGGIMRVPVKLPNLGSTAPAIPLAVTEVRWYGSTPGGAPTIDITKIVSQGATLDNDQREGSGAGLTSVGIVTGTTDSNRYTASPAIECYGDEYMYVDVLAGTNNLDVYHLVIQYTKEV